jgi:hypothetical protein
MTDNQQSPLSEEESSGCVDDRGFLERLWCRIDPFGNAYPVWIALFLIALILLFAIALRFDFDLSQFGLK